MTLFHERVRPSREPLRPGGKLFEFYDTCGRFGFDRFRTIVNDWMRELSEPDRVALTKQMQTGDNSQFSSGLVELLIHALLKRQGYDVECHPKLPHTTKRPDFAVRDRKKHLLAYVEVTTNNPPQEETARSNKEATIRNAIDAAPLPDGCRLGYRVERYGTSTPSLKRLIADVQKWAQENIGQRKGEHAERVFTAGDWQIELQLFTRFRGSSNGHCIVATTGDMRWLGPALDVRDCLEQKTKRYGRLGTPYLIVVADCAEQIATRKDGVSDALTEAVLGDEVFVMRLGGKDGELRRKRNGFFGWPDNPQNKNVSAVLVLPDADLWRLRREEWQPTMAFHPWTEVPLSKEFLPLPAFTVSDGRWKFDKGTIAADILGIPNPWPPEEDFKPNQSRLRRRR